MYAPPVFFDFLIRIAKLHRNSLVYRITQVQAGSEPNPRMFHISLFGPANGNFRRAIDTLFFILRGIVGP